MTTHTPASSEDDAAHLRDKLADQLREQGLSDERILAAVQTVPRHVFVPATSVAEAYADAPVYTKYAGQVRLSAASKPSIVAMQLEQADLQPGQHVLEIGTGTGYNAALMGHLVGPSGHVTSIEVDVRLAAEARAHLAQAGVTNVSVLCGDGALGAADGAPYERIVATASVAAIPAAWQNQAASGARLVVPLRLAGSLTRSVALERDGDLWRSVDSSLCAFVPLRDSVSADRRRLVDLTSDGQVILHVYDEQAIDPSLLRGVLDAAATTVFSGVDFGDHEPLDEVWLWLACALPNAVSRMETDPGARDSGLVAPLLPWGAMATVKGRSLAYLTKRTNARGRVEMGAIGHGPDGPGLAEAMCRQITAWAAYRDMPITVEFQPPEAAAVVPQVIKGRFVMPRSTGRVVVTWRL